MVAGVAGDGVAGVGKLAGVVGVGKLADVLIIAGDGVACPTYLPR